MRTARLYSVLGASIASVQGGVILGHLKPMMTNLMGFEQVTPEDVVVSSEDGGETQLHGGELVPPFSEEWYMYISLALCKFRYQSWL